MTTITARQADIANCLTGSDAGEHVLPTSGQFINHTGDNDWCSCILYTAVYLPRGDNKYMILLLTAAMSIVDDRSIVQSTAATKTRF